MKSPIKFNSVADRIKYKKQQLEKARREREIMDESDRSIAALVCYGIGSFIIVGILLLGLMVFSIIKKNNPHIFDKQLYQTQSVSIAD